MTMMKGESHDPIGKPNSWLGLPDDRRHGGCRRLDGTAGSGGFLLCGPAARRRHRLRGLNMRATRILCLGPIRAPTATSGSATAETLLVPAPAPSAAKSGSLRCPLAACRTEF